jgi:hypothetical protein
VAPLDGPRTTKPDGNCITSRWSFFLILDVTIGPKALRRRRSIQPITKQVVTRHAYVSAPLPWFLCPFWSICRLYTGSLRSSRGALFRGGQCGTCFHAVFHFERGSRHHFHQEQDQSLKSSGSSYFISGELSSEGY